MSLIEQVRKHQVEVRILSHKAGHEDIATLAKIETAVLTTLLGESQVDGKDPTDDQLVKTIQKFIKNIDQFISISKDVLTVERLKVERNALSVYLPQELTEQDIRDFLDTAVNNGDKVTKAFMGKINLLAKSSGKVVDNQLASLILQSYLV